MAMTPEERQACFRAATRFLNGHGPTRPRAALAALALEAGEEERADAYGAGEALQAFERDLAARLGKAAAVFMPSGTMAQQIALRIWSQRRSGAPVAFHPLCHLELHEQRGYAALHGLQARLVGQRTRLLGRADLDAIPEPISALLLELPQRELGGLLPTWPELEAQVAWARERGVALHLDGARLWETQPFYGRPLDAIAAGFDSVYVSFYKILGGIAGAALAGPADLVAEARLWLRRHGGNLVTQYPLLLAARAGLRDRLPRVPRYVERARALAPALAAVPGVRVTPDPPHTNMMHLALPGDADTLLDRAAALARDDGLLLFTWLRPCDLPGFHVTEVNVGDGALAVSDAEAAGALARILSGA